MSGVWYRFLAEMRTRWRAWIGLGLLVGIAAGVCLALAAGARRTDTAYERLLDAQLPYDITVFQGGFAGDIPTPPDFLDRVERLPQVVEAGRFTSLYDLGGRTGDGRRIGEPDYLQTIAPMDEEAAAVLARQKLLEGRHPDPTVADEVAVNFTVADIYGLDVADTFELEVFTEDQVAPYAREGLPASIPISGAMRTFRVVGIFAGAGDFPPRSLGDGAGTVNLTPAFVAANPDYTPIRILTVRLAAGGDDLVAFREGVEEIVPGGAGFDAFANFSVALQHEATDRAIHLLAVALWVLTALAVLTGVLVVGQALLRAAAIESSEYPRLAAVGFTRAQLIGLAAARGSVVAAVGAFAAVAIAVALSPLFPLGLARTAEPDPGVRFDVPAVLTGAVIVTAVVGVLAAVAGWRMARSVRVAARDTRGRARVSRIGGMFVRGGFSPPAVAGVRMALEPGRGATAVPARTTLAGAAIGIAALAGALTFGAGLQHLLDTPRLYGWNWDVTVGDGYNADAYDQVVPALADEPAVAAVGAGTFAAVEVDRREVFVLAVDAVQGGIGPTVVEGRAPAAPDEILLGSETLGEIDASVGDAVAVRFLGTFNEGEAIHETQPRALNVVGRGVLPEQSDVGLDDAGAMTYSGLRELAAAEEDLPRNLFPVEFADGVDPEVGLAEVTEAVDLYTVPLQQPTDLVNFGRVDALPVLGAGMLGLVAIAMLTHLLLSSVRRRRRDLALLKTLGFTGRQVSESVAWQASTLATVALLFGLPLGVAGGRWAWTIAADRLGVVAEPVVPLPALLLLVPVAVVAANVVAAGPAWFAARTSPAALLREE